MVLATDIQYIGYKSLRQVYLYSVHIYGGLFTNIADWLVESWISKGLERILAAACYRYVRDNDDNLTPLTQRTH